MVKPHVPGERSGLAIRTVGEMTGTLLSSNRKIVLTLAGIAAVAAVVRYFLKGWLEPLGVPTVVGSFLASITTVLLVGLVLLGMREEPSSVGGSN